MTRLVGISVAEHVDRPSREVFGVGLKVAHVCLGVTAGAVEKHQRRAAGVTGVQVAGAHSSRVEVALRERDALEVAPDAVERRGREERTGLRGREERIGFRHSSPSLDDENRILVFCKHSAYLSYIRVHYSQSITLASAGCQGKVAPWLRRPVRRAPTPHRTVRPARRRLPGVWRRCNWSPRPEPG